MIKTSPILAPLALIIILGTLIYSNTFDNAFVFDDHAFIEHRSSLRDISSREGWTDFLQKTRRTRLVGFLSFALNYHFHRYDVFGYHLVNLVIHLLNACLVWWFMTLILALPKFQKDGFAQYRDIAALFGALLFLTHPLQTQAVTYIYQRLASMVALFYLLALTLYVQGRVRQQASKSAGVFFLFSGATAFLAMLTKENSFTLPLAALLTEAYFLQDRTPMNEKRGASPRWAKWVPLVFLIVIPLLMQFNFDMVFHHRYFRGQENTMVTSGIYLTTQFRVIVTYIRLLFVPVNQNLIYDYPLNFSVLEWPVLLSLVFLLSVIFLAVKYRKKFSLVSFGVFWFFLTLSVESSVIPIRYVIFEHRLYLPLAGFAIGLSAGLFSLLRDPRRYKVCALMIIVILSMLTYHRNDVWQDPFTLWSDVVRKSPNNPYVQFSMGRAHNSRGQYEQAIPCFHKAISLYQHDGRVIDISLLSMTYNSLGVAYFYTYQDEKAIEAMKKALEYNPSSVQAKENLEKMYQELQNQN